MWIARCTRHLTYEPEVFRQIILVEPKRAHVSVCCYLNSISNSESFGLYYTRRAVEPRSYCFRPSGSLSTMGWETLFMMDSLSCTPAVRTSHVSYIIWNGILLAEILHPEMMSRHGFSKFLPRPECTCCEDKSSCLL